jgi:carbamoyl-phosphate synthase large subunit
MLGRKLKDLGYSSGLWREPDFVVVKAPVFSFEKLGQVDTSLGPEMNSTGEVMGIDKNFSGALHKAITGAGTTFHKTGKLLVSLAPRDYEEALPVIENFQKFGFELLATKLTGEYLQENGLAVHQIENTDGLQKGEVQLIINTPSEGRNRNSRGFRLRRQAAEYRIPCFTSLDTAAAYLSVLEDRERNTIGLCYQSLQEYLHSMA